MLLWCFATSRDAVGCAGRFTMQDEQAHSISEDDARGGVTGHNVRYVLGAGLVAIIASFMFMAMFA
jgi:hypothetical protein